MKTTTLKSNTTDRKTGFRLPESVTGSGAGFHGIHKIVYAIDYLNSDRESLHQLVGLARAFESEITLLHIIGQEDSTKVSQTTLDRFTKSAVEGTGYDRIHSRVIKASSVEEKLNDYVDRRNADLFVMSTRKHHLFDRLFGKSLTKQLSYHSKMPLMALHHQENSVFFI